MSKEFIQTCITLLTFISGCYTIYVTIFSSRKRVIKYDLKILDKRIIFFTMVITSFLIIIQLSFLNYVKIFNYINIFVLADLVSINIFNIMKKNNMVKKNIHIYLIFFFKMFLSSFVISLPIFLFFENKTMKKLMENIPNGFLKNESILYTCMILGIIIYFITINYLNFKLLESFYLELVEYTFEVFYVQDNNILSKTCSELFKDKDTYILKDNPDPKIVEEIILQKELVKQIKIKKKEN